MKRSVILVASLLIGLQASASAADPAWWATRGVKNSESSSNLSAATIGQAKHVVAMALEELETRLPPAAYDALETDVEAIVDLAVPTTQAGFDAQKAVLAVGQLKAISAPFYQRLDAENHLWLEFQLNKNRTKDPANAANMFPWTSATGDDQNKAIATIGQLKAVFALRFESLNLDPEGDEDGDGLTNGDEAVFGTDPLDPSDGPQVDSDGDGVPNTTETANGTDPDNAGDFPVQWLTARNQVIGATHKDTNSNVHSGHMRYNRWDDVSVDDTDIASELTPEMMIAARDNLDKVPLPDLQELVGSGKADAFNLPDAYPVAGASFYMDAASVPHAPRGGNYTVRRCWLHAPAKPDAQEFHFLKTTQHYYTNSAGTFYDDSVIESLAVVIPANQSYSDHIDLKTTTSAQVGTDHKTFVSLLPVEVRGYATGERNGGSSEANEKYRHRIPDPADYTGFKTESKTELKIVQWGDNYIFDPSNNAAFVHAKFKEDVDIFRIRLPDIDPPAGTAEHRIKIWTVDSTGTILDQGAEVDLNVFGDFHETAALGLVADDETDDNFPVEGKADGALGDRTYRIKLGGKLKFQWLTCPGTGEKPIFEIPIRVKKIVTAKGFLLKGTTDAGTATYWFERAKKIYSAIGVDLQYSLQTIDPLPAGVDLDIFDIPNEITGYLHEMRAETKALMDDPRCQVPLHTIPVFFVNELNPAAQGVANTPSYMAPGDEKYGGAIFIDSNHPQESVMAHELAHVLLDAQHEPSSNALWNHYYLGFHHKTNIWFGKQSALQQWSETGISAHRRLADTMRSRIWKSPYAKNP